MIAHSLVWFILLILLPDVYLWVRYLRLKRWWQQLLWFLPSVALLVAAVLLSREPDFVPDDMTWVNLFLLALGLIAVPKLVYALCTLFGRRGHRVGQALVAVLWVVLLYGSFVGNRRFEVRRVELSFQDLPASFDGYRIVQFSDIHLGSMTHALLNEMVDSINAQKADLIAFTGDIQNKQPSEILPFTKKLSSLKAVDGVFTVLGNHDYADYTDVPYFVKYEREDSTVGLQQQMGWTMLMNSRRYVCRGQDSIVVAGMENDGEGRFPQRGEVSQALWKVGRSEFILMLEHDPSAWRRKILRQCHAQLTLSGHTHGMQFELFGLSPLALLGREVDGLYERAGRYLYVSKGVSGVVPFRFGATPEIVVFTLRKK
ncbi:MAG: metallophosphoesterase [Prevotella sp.]|nr:metallophosphoesterase [Prevotella sp.]